MKIHRRDAETQRRKEFMNEPTKPITDAEVEQVAEHIYQHWEQLSNFGGTALDRYKIARWHLEQLAALKTELAAERASTLAYAEETEKLRMQEVAALRGENERLRNCEIADGEVIAGLKHHRSNLIESNKILHSQNERIREALTESNILLKNANPRDITYYKLCEVRILLNQKALSSTPPAENPLRERNEDKTMTIEQLNLIAPHPLGIRARCTNCTCNNNMYNCRSNRHIPENADELLKALTTNPTSEEEKG
jgi:hypothetical protein